MRAGSLRHGRAANAILVMPAADGWEGATPHGFGDEMLVLGLLNGLSGRFSGGISLLRLNGPGERELSWNRHASRLIGFQGDWLSRMAYSEFLTIASSHSHFAVIGADVLDGAYGVLNSLQRLRFLVLAAKMGMRTAITGCSFNGTTNAWIGSRVFSVVTRVVPPMCLVADVPAKVIRDNVDWK
jgi:hypothetical protein